MSSGYQINVNFSGQGSDSPAGASKGSSSDFLNQVLTRLTTAVDKLTNVLNKQMFISGGTSAGSGGGGGETPAQKSKTTLGSILSAGTIAAVAVTTVRWMSANANAIMAQAGNRGAFGGAGILGQANQSFGSYVGNYYDIERARQIARNNAIGQSAGGLLGGGAGAIAGFAGAGVAGALKGGAAGASTGAAVGDYATARLVNANVQQAMLVDKALAERRANASTSEWQTGFSRFGLNRTSTVIAGSDITGTDPINANLSQAFESKYGTVKGGFNPNYNAILNGIVPYMQSSPLDSKNGDLNKVAQNFTQAGFAVSQFGQLTMQASQYQVLTGKNITQFSDDIKSARSKFGDVYDVGSNQTALNLMSMGYSQNQAQNIAFQSKFNSGILNNTSQFTSLSTPSYYSAQALSKSLGFNLLDTIKTGQIQGAGKGVTGELQKEISNYYAGKGIGKNLMVLNSQGYNTGQVSQWLQGAVSPLKGAVNEKGSYSDAQTQAMKDLTDGIKNALNNVGDMVVNATNVTIYNASPGTLQSGIVASTAQKVGKYAIDYLSPDSNLLRNATDYLSGKRPLTKGH